MTCIRVFKNYSCYVIIMSQGRYIADKWNNFCATESTSLTHVLWACTKDIRGFHMLTIFVQRYFFLRHFGLSFKTCVNWCVILRCILSPSFILIQNTYIYVYICVCIKKINIINYKILLVDVFQSLEFPNKTIFPTAFS